MTELTVAFCVVVLAVLVLAVVVLLRRPRPIAPSVDETLAELRAATADLIDAATTAREAADRIQRQAPP